MRSVSSIPPAHSPCRATVLQPLCTRCVEVITLDQGEEVADGEIGRKPLEDRLGLPRLVRVQELQVLGPRRRRVGRSGACRRGAWAYPRRIASSEPMGRDVGLEQREVTAWAKASVQTVWRS